MMKKKTKEQEEAKEKDINESTENKYNNNSGGSTGKDEEIPALGDESAPDEGDPEEGIQTADKVAPGVKSAEEKLAEMQDKYIRLSAEFDNYRKRTLREKMDMSKYAAEELFRKIIPIMDDFDRAIKHMETSTDSTAIKDGIDLIYNKFSEFLKQNGIREIESMNSGFNVDLHEAIAKIPVEEEEKKGRIIDVVQKGYYIQDKVLRHSKVVVGE